MMDIFNVLELEPSGEVAILRLLIYDLARLRTHEILLYADWR